MVVWFRFCFIYKIFFFCKPCLNFAILVADFTLFGKVFRNPTFDGKQVIITQGVIMWDWRALLSHIIQIFEWKIIRYYYSYMSVACVFFYRHLMFPTLILYILSFILKKCALILKWCVWPLSVLFLINCPGLVFSYLYSNIGLRVD